MGGKLDNAGRTIALTKNGRRLLVAGNTKAAKVQDMLGRFDAEAWSAVVEEQRLCIAAAAGVDPSKVRIHIGH